MKLNTLLTISGVYLALVGLGFLFAPTVIMFGTVGPGASAALIAILRGVASTFIAIAVLNWAARNAEPSTARNAIVLANTIGFGLAGVLDVIAIFSGAPAMQWIPTILNLLIAVAFWQVGQAWLLPQSNLANTLQYCFKLYCLKSSSH